MTALIEIRNASKIFGGKSRFGKDQQGTVALNDFTMTVHDAPPAITAVVGESGSGKTTLVRLLLGLTTPTSGDVLYRGVDIRKLSKESHLSFLRDVQTIMQDPYEVYNPFYKVDHVLKVPIDKFKLAKNPAEAQILMEETLNAVGLRPEDTLGRHPHQLSGGQRQRIMVARALLTTVSPFTTAPTANGSVANCRSCSPSSASSPRGAATPDPVARWNGG